MALAHLQQILAAPPPGPGHLHAVLDAARCPELPDRLADSGAPHVSLFAGQAGYRLGDVAPYLVQLQPGSPLARWVFEDGWGDAWGVFFKCASDLYSLRRHLGRFLLADDELGVRYLFRIYDPRVLRPFLQSASPEERALFFGPVLGFWVEDGEGEVLQLKPPAGSRRGPRGGRAHG